MNLKFWESKNKSVFDDSGQSFTVGSGLFGGLTRRRLLAQYREYVFSCVNVRANELGKYDPMVGRYDAKGNFVGESRHPFMVLLGNPNPIMSGFELWQGTQAWQCITGEAFWYYQLDSRGKPISIDLLRPDLIEVSIQQDIDPSGRFQVGDVNGYVYTNGRGIQIPLEVEEVEHFKYWNPFNPYRGYSPLEAGFGSVSTDNHTIDFQNSFMRNNATPASIVSFKGNIKKETFEKIKKMFNEQYGGADKAGKSLFIRDTDMQIEKLGLSLADLDLTSLKDGSGQRIRAIYGIPKPLLGDTDSAGLSRANIEAEEYIFQKYTVENEKCRYDHQLIRACKRFYGQDIAVKHTVFIPEDREFKLREEVELAGKTVPRNFYLEQHGFSPIEGGWDLEVPFNVVPLSQWKIPEVSTAKSYKAIRRTVKASDAVTEQNLFRVLDRIELEQSSKYEQKLVNLLNYQKQQVLNKLDFLSGKKALDSQVLPDEDSETEHIAAAVLLILLGSVERGGQTGYALLKRPDLNVLIDEATQQAIKDSTVRLMRDFNRQTIDAIQWSVREGLASNESVDQIAKRIESVYSEAKGYRAERIAQTEVHKAVNKGMADAYRQAGYAFMRWQANPGACEYCRSMDGQVTQIGVPFLEKGTSVVGVDGGTYQVDYESVSHADLHPNCRCTLVPVVDPIVKQLLPVEVPVEIETSETESLRKALEESEGYVVELEKLLEIDDGSSAES